MYESGSQQPSGAPQASKTDEKACETAQKLGAAALPRATAAPQQAVQAIFVAEHLWPAASACELVGCAEVVVRVRRDQEIPHRKRPSEAFSVQKRHEKGGRHHRKTIETPLERPVPRRWMPGPMTPLAASCAIQMGSLSQRFTIRKRRTWQGVVVAVVVGVVGFLPRTAVTQWRRGARRSCSSPRRSRPEAFGVR